MTKPFEDTAALLALIHTGDWSRTPAAVNAVVENQVPTDLRELVEYRRRLQDTLIAARAARAHLAADLGRLQAARQFSSYDQAYQNGIAVPERSATRVSGGHTI
jgi:hypothetical protein